jgi:hypothetical protein
VGSPAVGFGTMTNGVMGSKAPDARTSADMKARTILAAGLSVSAATLSVWLIVWLIFFPVNVGLEVFSFGGNESPPVNPSVSFQESDARAFRTRDPSDGRKGVAHLLESLRSYLKNRQGRPSIVYLSAPGYRSAFDKDDPLGEALLAAPEVFSGVLPEKEADGLNIVGLKSVIDMFQAAPGKRLLILDVVRVGTDRDLGVFDDDVVAWLKAYEKTSKTERPESWDGFAVLCACAPGQWNWTSDADGRSVFSYFVVEALGRGCDTDKIVRLGDLGGWVAAKVHAWVRDHRGAVQVPVVLGDLAMRFPLPRKLIPPGRGEPDRSDPEVLQDKRVQLSTHYHRMRDYEKQGLYALSPFAWRDYRTALLRAERFYRAGRPGEAGVALREAEEAEKSLATAGGDWRYPSLALSLKTASGPKRREAMLQAEKALKALAEGPTDDHPPEGKAAVPSSLADVVRKGAKEKKGATRQEFAEGQLIDWATDFVGLLDRVKAGLDSETWLDAPRARLVSEAVSSRRLAETAAASSWQLHPGIRQLVDQGDKDRKAAQDQLFSGELPAETVRSRLEAAKASYQAAIKVADAVELSCRVQADLPFLGAWYVLRQGRLREKIDAGLLEAIARDCIALNQLLDSAFDARNQPSLPKLGDKADALERSYSSLSNIFGEECKLSSIRRWRVVDDLLSVPGIDPKVREALVDRSMELANLDALEKPVDDAKPAKTSSEIKDFAKKALNNDLKSRQMAQDALSGPSPSVKSPVDEWETGDSPRAEPDPSFALTAGGMGLLEWCLLRIGSAPQFEEELFRLKEAVDKVLAGSSEEIKISPRVRNLRRSLAAALDAKARKLAEPEAAEAWWSDRVVLERAWLSLPAAIGDKSGAFAKEAAELRLGRMLTWQAERLLEDLDVARAGSFLEHAPEVYRHTRSHREARKRLDALGKPGVAVLERQPAGEFTLKETTSLNLTLVLKTVDALPAGQAAFVIGASDDSRLRTSADVRGASRWGSELVTVGGAPPRQAPVLLKVHRTDYDNAKDVQAVLSPTAFYRGLTIQTPESIPFRLVAIKNSYNIRLKTAGFANVRVGGNRKKLMDQHVVHPDDCYLHTGASHTIDLELSYRPDDPNEKPGSVGISAKMDGKMLWPMMMWDIKQKPKMTTHLMTVHANEVEKDGSTLQVEVWSGTFARLNSKTVTVHQVDTSLFYDAVATVDKDSVTVRITRKPDDPISAEEYCQVSVDGGRLEAVIHSDPRLNTKTSAEEGFPQSVPLLQREYVDFRFKVDGANAAPPNCHAMVAGVPLKVKVPTPKAPLVPGLPAPGGLAAPDVPSAGPAPPAGG